MEVNSLDTRAAMVGWPVFHDGHVRRFLFVWIENQIAKLGKRLETITEEELKGIQGQIAALRTVLTVLEKRSIETLLSEITKP